MREFFSKTIYNGMSSFFEKIMMMSSSNVDEQVVYGPQWMMEGPSMVFLLIVGVVVLIVLFLELVGLITVIRWIISFFKKRSGKTKQNEK